MPTVALNTPSLSGRNSQYDPIIKKKVSPHTLRHTYATHLYEEDVDLLAIQDLLGHESLETTKIYTKVSKERLMKVESPADLLDKG